MFIRCLEQCLAGYFVSSLYMFVRQRKQTYNDRFPAESSNTFEEVVSFPSLHKVLVCSSYGAGRVGLGEISSQTPNL